MSLLDATDMIIGGSTSAVAVGIYLLKKKKLWCLGTSIIAAGISVGAIEIIYWCAFEIIYRRAVEIIYWCVS